MAAPRHEIDVVVIGAGVVGLAAAAALASRGRSVVVLERAGGVGRGVTSRNSEVIHAGLYYPTGSLKAELCVRGRALLYERCARLGVPHAKLGKLVVATDVGEEDELERLHSLAAANGVPGVERLGRHDVSKLEPVVSAASALHSRETGIVDAHALTLSYMAEAEARGAVVLLHHEVVDIERRSGGGYRVVASASTGPASGETGTRRRLARESVDCEAVVNAAGLASDRVAAVAGLDVDAMGYRQRPCKGHYFALAPGVRLGVSRLVYPVPAGPGLGIHVTLDLAGRVRLGPDAEYVERSHPVGMGAPEADEYDYSVPAERAESFARAVRRYLPALRSEWLVPDQAGVRPKLAGPGDGFRDFVVAEESAAGRPGLVTCAGIESPGLTAAPAIAERIVALLKARS